MAHLDGLALAGQLARHVHQAAQVAAEQGTALARIAASGLPGNVRQLEHLLASAWVLGDGGTLDAPLFDELLGGTTVDPREPLADRLALAADDHAALAPEAAAASPSEVRPRNEAEWKVLEHERILAALTAAGWNRVRAATELGMPRRTFYRRLKEHGIL